MQAVWRVGAASQSLGRPHVAPRGRGLSAPARRVSAPRTAPRARLALVGPCVRRRRPSDARSAKRGERRRRPSDARSAERGGASSARYLLGFACATGFRTPPLPTAWLRLRRPSDARSAERGARRGRRETRACRSTPSQCDGVECIFAFPEGGGGAPSGASVHTGSTPPSSPIAPFHRPLPSGCAPQAPARRLSAVGAASTSSSSSSTSPLRIRGRPAPPPFRPSPFRPSPFRPSPFLSPPGLARAEVCCPGQWAAGR